MTKEKRNRRRSGELFYFEFGKMRLNYILTFSALVIILLISIANGLPTNSLRREKRQSDQRIAELETLLALQKYGQQKVRNWGRVRELTPPGYGLIDFDKIGRRKKSTRFSPGRDGDGDMSEEDD